MDKNRPPHLPKKRPVVTIDGEAAPVDAEAARTEGPQAVEAAAIDALPDERTDRPEAAPAPEAGAADAAPDGKPVAQQPLSEEPVAQQAVVEESPPVSEAPAAAPPPAPAVARASRGGSVTSGLIGAVVALCGGFGLQALGYLPAPGGTDQRVTALEAQLQSLAAQDAGDIEGEIAALKESIAALTAAGPSADAGAELAARVAALEEQFARSAAASTGAADPALLERLAALESRVQTGADASGPMEQLSAETKAGMAALNAEIAALKDQLASRAADPNLAAAVAATALRAAVDRGGPFAGELETLATFQPGSPAVEALRAFAATGVPPRTDIIAGFEDAAAAMLAADAPVNPDATLMERLIDGARGLVRVRPVGDVEGDTTGARIARIGEALTRSDDAAVETEFAALSAPVRAAGEPFMQRFRARAEADRLIADAVRAAATGSGS